MSKPQYILLQHGSAGKNIVIKDAKDEETVTLTAMPEREIELIDTADNTNNNEMVTVLQQRLVQMTRDEAYRQGQIIR